jgi:hypothetical protein
MLRIGTAAGGVARTKGTARQHSEDRAASICEAISTMARKAVRKYEVEKIALKYE